MTTTKTKTKTKTKTLNALLALLAASVSFASPASQAADTPLTLVLDWSINTNHTGLLVAEAKGFFTDQGLKVAIESPPETGAAALVLAGTAQIAVSYQEEVTMARVAGRPLTAIAALLQHNTSGFAARVEAGIKRPRDFAGKAYGGWGSPIEEAMVRSLVAQDGGDPEAVEIVPIGSMDLFAATDSGIDLAWIFEGWDGVAAELRGIDINYMPLASVPALDYYTPVLIAEQQWLEENPDTAQAFLEAVEQGYRFAIDNPEEAADILLEQAPELDADLVQASQTFLSPRYQADAARWGEMALERWQGYADWLDDNGLLEGKFVAAEAFTNDYLPE